MLWASNGAEPGRGWGLGVIAAPPTTTPAGHPPATERYFLAAGCGLRLGEILGLEVDDIDFDVREVHVRRQLKVLKGRQPFLGPVKTSTSARTVELPDVVAVALRQHLADGCDAVEVDDDTDRRRPVRRAARLLFKGVGGEPVNAATFSRTWATARGAVGLPARWGIHGLRHYYATVLIHAGASVKTCSSRWGTARRPSRSTPTCTSGRTRSTGPGCSSTVRSAANTKRRPRRL